MLWGQVGSCDVQDILPEHGRKLRGAFKLRVDHRPKDINNRSIVRAEKGILDATEPSTPQDSSKVQSRPAHPNANNDGFRNFVFPGIVAQGVIGAFKLLGITFGS